MLFSLQMQKLVLLFNFRSRRKTNFIHKLKLKLQLSPVALTCFYSSRFLAIGYSLVAIPLTPCRTVKKPGGTTCSKADHLWQPYLVRGDHPWQQKLPQMVRWDQLWRGTICGVTDHLIQTTRRLLLKTMKISAHESNLWVSRDLNRLINFHRQQK